MNTRHPTHTTWSRRDMLRGSAAALMGAYGLAPRYGLAADSPTEYDGSKCHTAEANQFRLFLHAGAYWLLWSMRRVMPKRSTWRVMQFDTLRLRLIKIAARVVELKTQP